MTRLTYYTATTLDGYIADPDDSLDWLFRQDQDENGPLNYEEFRSGLGAGVMGATTYEWILDHESGSWPYTLPMWVMTAASAVLFVGAGVIGLLTGGTVTNPRRKVAKLPPGLPAGVTYAGR